ncbi:MAG: hypothetical protein A2Y28_01810 [Chlamydiae bacterium GWC2_50_10]|nr:MAG: hypothetical protein A2Z85_02475 [Chlamydiae bacterium GWA2_50_15]OGN53555.1 MAG: hypothetical protein A2Y28_01810 [Chlamydiae bacterium GWC2_50_10]OGN56156.1 MAG: hypothetical protein A2098_04765 [Chlamydiae bacterium GWF2_49_8]OGN58137.1 MAG: hypothetical protein A3D18_05825 [Chlamydiae bacterium RIFCSPHIGHO2_02_FULL_49_29]OGN64639.1 MAG: hypothetical protein A3E26_05745 [Chlamydiae bacterium RIFCSPHIGHO2_12_FULL_49_32]OGN69429.1 MAG: hypothetical protein A3I15_06120 [Chlamydiae bact
MKSPLLKLFLFCLLFVAVERFCYVQTQGFRVGKILSPPHRDVRWHFPAPSEEERIELKKTLSQPFTFLSKGNECYAFVSEDGQYVLKFFKHQLLRLSFLHQAILTLPQTPFIRGLYRAKEERLMRSFISCKSACDHFRSETGIITHNLSKEWTIDSNVLLKDRLHIAHAVDLDQTTFILQKKATLAPQKFRELMEEGKRGEALLCMESTLSLIGKRLRSGFYDRDFRPEENIGFIGTQAIEIDTGSFIPDPSLNNHRAIKRAFLYDACEFQTWVAREHPSLVEPFQQMIGRYLEKACWD